MAAATARALRYQTQLNSTANLAQQAQAAGTAAAAALDQNGRARIVDGLGIGGLQPAVTQITPASADPVGVATWQGANLPTVAASNPNQVTVTQTASRAILSWTTFNVGQHTTLTFQQQQNGVAQPGWVALNRVVGVLDPRTGLPLTGSVPAPSQILGSIKADGTVLVLNQNGILFGPTSQVNVGSLVATSLEIGRAYDVDTALTPHSRTLAQRDTEFLADGLLGYAEQNTPGGGVPFTTFAPQIIAPTAQSNSFVYDSPSAVIVSAGASLASSDGGYLMLLAPQVVNAGQLSASDGEVAIQSGQAVILTASTGTGSAPGSDPDVRGLVVTDLIDSTISAPPPDTVDLAPNSIVLSPRGYISIGSSQNGAVIDSGYLASTTSVGSNGYINIFGGAINFIQSPSTPAPVIAIGPDGDPASLPQDPTSLSTFKPSRVRIGQYTAYSTNTDGAPVAPVTTPTDITLGSGSLVYAPGGNISIGSDPSPAINTGRPSQIIVDSGATIDAAGLTDVVVPASRNSIEIDPVKGNELADSPAFRNGFLNGSTVYLDPRISGVSANGVAYVGSPLIAAAGYVQQVGESVSELMVKGGSVSIGVNYASSNVSPSPANAPTFVIQLGATIDIAGGWRTFQAGEVQQSYLIDASGQVIPISQANPDAVYVGIYTGYTVTQPRWGLTQTYVEPLLTGAKYEGAYGEGQDAGALTLNGSVLGFDASLYAFAFAGPQQILAATPGTAATSLAGDVRYLQGAPSQIPAAGFVAVDELGVGNVVTGGTNAVGGGDITIQGASYVAGGYTPQVSTGTHLNADEISASGLAQFTVQTTGAFTVAKDAALTLAPGGALEARTDRTVVLDGTVVVPGGRVDVFTIGLDTSHFGSVLAPEAAAVGSLDVVVNGALSVAGLWTNDFGAQAAELSGSAYLGGGEITLQAAPAVTLIGVAQSSPVAAPNTDISGSILVNAGALLNLSGGGYLAPTGAIDVSAKGGNLSLIQTSNFYQLPVANTSFRTTIGVSKALGSYVPDNPATETSRISIADGAINDAGFAGGGAFTLVTPAFALADAGGSSEVNAGFGAILPIDFFSKAGFSSYNIVSTATALLPNIFSNGYGGYNAIRETQVAEVRNGQTLDLEQAYFSPILNSAQIAALRSLPSRSSLSTVLTPEVPIDAWDQKATSLNFGGLLELKVDVGGLVVGAASSNITSGSLVNQGTIRVPGGTITQSDTLLPTTTAVGVQNLTDVFGPTAANGTVLETSTNVFFATGPAAGLTNAQVAADFLALTPVYLLADLPANRAVDLAPGSVTDLSGEAIVNPRALPKGNVSPTDFVDGRVIGGGLFIVSGTLNLATGISGVSKAFLAEPGAVLTLSGAQATFDRPTVLDPLVQGDAPISYAPTQIWSDGGSLSLYQGGLIAGASVSAVGGAPLALGGTLTASQPVLYAAGIPTPAQVGGTTPVSAGDITAAGFSTLVALGGLTSSGDVILSLPRALFVQSSPIVATATPSAPDIGSGGQLEVDAPYIALTGGGQMVSTAAVGALGANSLVLKADAINITGGVLFDRSIGEATLIATGDLRFTGAAPPSFSAATTLIGALAVNGDLSLTAAQFYPTTGSTFTLSTSGVSSPTASLGGTITFGASGATPAAPYSAGGSLTVAAANIVQDGVVRAPLGTLTLGTTAGIAALAPSTVSLTLASDGTTSVSADGLNIPYGATTDQVEWYFTPTASAALTAPPAGILHLAGALIDAASGATVDVKGGGDVYAYEFIAGKGGTRDVLDRFNPDQFSSTNGYQYPDQRQVYAIVPGISASTVAAYDPIYSSDYGSLYGPSQAGRQVYLNAAPGVAAGWYTLLPAKYALLPGGMRVVQDTSQATPPPVNGTLLPDGTIATSGYFGIAGVNTRSADLLVFDVQSQATVLSESKIALTTGNAYFSALATHKGDPVPRLPIDAGRLLLDPVASLVIDATFQTAPATGGRGSLVDLSGASIIIDDPAAPVVPPLGTIELTDTSIDNLGAASLLIGGTRTDNADGTTNLLLTTHNIILSAGATLTGPEIILATDGRPSKITVENGASIVASGAVAGESSGAYVIDGLENENRVQFASGGFLRVSNGPERLLTRLNVMTASGSINIGAAKLDGSPADLSGEAIEINVLGAVKLATTDQIEATELALGASAITFDSQGVGLVLTPALQTILAATPKLTLESDHPIAFATGTYAFQTLTLDTPGLSATNGAIVAVNASGPLTLQNTGAAGEPCFGTGGFACGKGSLALSADTIAFGSGNLRTYGADNGVTLTAAHGVFADGIGGLDVGVAPLTINSPFVGDRGAGPTVVRGVGGSNLADAVQPELTFVTTGAVSIQSVTPASAFTAQAGTPGSQLTIDGSSITVTGAELRATAGSLTLAASQGIAVSGGALIETPAYAKTFGDAADPVTVSASGGLLTFTALAGDIAISDDSMLVVGGPQDQAGTLVLTAQNGAVYAYHGAPTDVVALASTLSAQGGGGSLTLDSGGAFDLSSFAEGSGKDFTNLVSIRSGAGDLTVAVGDTLTAHGVTLTADGGQVAISGTIDTSGASGGDVGLYGATGVHLASTALIDAHARGNGATSTLQAEGGNVTLGVDYTGLTATDPLTGVVSGAQSGLIAVDPGAVIDVAATNTANRLVDLNRTDGTYYTFVAGDTGGVVTFRAPVLTQGAGETVGVALNSSIDGASSVVLDAFERIHLDTLALGHAYTGVAQTGAGITLNLTTTRVGQVNALADAGGPVVSYVQDFAGAVTLPSSLTSLANFHARPGVELDAPGRLTLSSDWNLGAGVVDVAGAVAAGLMAPDALHPGLYAVVATNPTTMLPDGATLLANEGKILADYTTATYRVGGTFLGEPGVLTLRAGGDLTLKGSVSDGFFNFADQTNPYYLNQALGGGNRVFQANLAPPSCTVSCTSAVPDFQPGTTASNSLSIVFPGTFGLLNPGGFSTVGAYVIPPAPYDAEANAPGAHEMRVNGQGLVSGEGDPLGSAALFPLLPTATGQQAAESWSYQFVAGAAWGTLANPSIFDPSVNPLTTSAGAVGNLVVQGQHVYGYAGIVGTTSYAANLNIYEQMGTKTVSLTPSQWYSDLFDQPQYSGLGPNSATTIDIATPAGQSDLSALAGNFFRENPSYPKQILANGNIVTSLYIADQFLIYVSSKFATFRGNYALPKESPLATTTYATAATAVRTGTGDIALAASGDIDLRNGDPTANPKTHEAALKLSGGMLKDANATSLHLGGTAVYTAGVRSELNMLSATDDATGLVYAVDLSANAVSPSDNLAAETLLHGSYVYGASVYGAGGGVGVGGVLVADPTYAQSGGNVTFDARGSVLSRRDTSLISEIQSQGKPSGVGPSDQPWRTGEIGTLVNLLIDPQVFNEGVGALSGGSITINAGGGVSDLSMVATESALTANVGGLDSSGRQPQALVNLGGGNVDVFAGGDILGGRLDVAAGNAILQAIGDVSSAGPITFTINPPNFVENTLRVRLSNGVLNIEAGRSALLQGIAALGLTTPVDPTLNNSTGFYAAGAAVNVLAGGAVTVLNVGSDITSVYPGTFEAVSLTGGVNLEPGPQGRLLLYPDAAGTLTLLAGGDITPTILAQLDSDPTLLPGAFTSFLTSTSGVASGLAFEFPAVLPDTPDATLRELHNPAITHAGDPVPNRIEAGGDIDGLTLSMAKQTRIGAGEDIINLVFLGQNVAPGDISRVTAGRDILATTALRLATSQIILPTVQGNTFVLGGPGALFVEAGRDAGPFLNSAVTPDGQVYGGGIITVGNQWNPWLAPVSADIYTEFGVAKGQDFAGLVSTYLDPAAFAAQPGYLFLQSIDSNGVSTPTRTQEVYGLSLVDWMRSVASDVISRYDTAAGVTTPPATAPALIQFMQALQKSGAATTAQALVFLPQLSDRPLPLIPWLQLHESAALASAYGTVDVSYAQAFATFQALPALTQREFLIKNVYFNELIQTSIPTSPSYLKYSRGYTAVNTLFPSSSGYTANSLAGGPAGALTTVETGNLDLRLATIQTDQGGDVAILGPGGQVLAGSVVATSVQAARRNFNGQAIYGGIGSAQQPSMITRIPTGYEGVLTLDGGSINAFTDQDFLLNQSRAFTERGGDVALWSSNADVNAGQGPRTTPDVSPAVVHIDANGFSIVDSNAAVSGAGIGAFGADAAGLAPDVFLIAPRGTVDAGDAGVRSSGNVFIAAFQVANADAISATGTISGAGGPAAINTGAQTSGDAAATAAAKAAQEATAAGSSQRPTIYVDVLGYLGDEAGCNDKTKPRDQCQ